MKKPGVIVCLPASEFNSDSPRPWREAPCFGCQAAIGVSASSDDVISARTDCEFILICEQCLERNPALNIGPLSTLVGGQQIYAHHMSRCAGLPCSVHNPSNHHMAAWPQNWREDVQLMERICPHGTGHPDPDHVAFIKSVTGKFTYRHCCDHCCIANYSHLN